MRIQIQGGAWRPFHFLYAYTRLIPIAKAERTDQIWGLRGVRSHPCAVAELPFRCLDSAWVGPTPVVSES